MKWSVIVLVVMGMVAATAAGLLAASLRARGNGDGAAKRAETQIVVAARPLEVNAIVDPESVAVRTVKLSQSVKDALTDPALAIGKPLRMSVAEGQAFTPACFAPDDSARNLASRVVTPGKRAKTISLAYDAALEGLLYPGCMVDVLWSFKGELAKCQPMSKTLLEKLPVLAINRQTILSDEAGEAATHNGRNSRQLVTLLVDSQQAAALQLAMDHGNISLVMRNPGDGKQVTSPAVPLRALAQEMFPMLALEDAGGLGEKFQELTRSVNERFAQLAARQAQPLAAAPVPVAQRGWETTVIRGSKVQVEQLADASAMK